MKAVLNTSTYFIDIMKISSAKVNTTASSLLEDSHTLIFSNPYFRFEGYTLQDPPGGYPMWNPPGGQGDTPRGIPMGMPRGVSPKEAQCYFCKHRYGSRKAPAGAMGPVRGHPWVLPHRGLLGPLSMDPCFDPKRLPKL